jgi:hypothetical protein
VSPQGFPNERIRDGPVEQSFSRCSQGQLFIDREGLRSSDSELLAQERASFLPGKGNNAILAIDSARLSPCPGWLEPIRIIAHRPYANQKRSGAKAPLLDWMKGRVTTH